MLSGSIPLLPGHAGNRVCQTSTDWDIEYSPREKGHHWRVGLTGQPLYESVWPYCNCVSHFTAIKDVAKLRGNSSHKLNIGITCPESIKYFLKV